MKMEDISVANILITGQLEVIALSQTNTNCYMVC